MESDRQPVLVTGAAGYLGGHVTALAQRMNWPIVTVGRGPSCDINGDLQDPLFVTGLVRETNPQAIIHCAARVPKTAEAYRDETIAAGNLTMVKNLVDAKPRHIVFCSSMTVYTTSAPVPVHEDSAASPQPGYAGSKRRAELALLESGATAITILRLPGLFGSPRLNGLLYNVAKSFSVGEIPTLPADPPLWAALHVEDAADMCLRATSHQPEAPRVLNVGYPDAFSIGDAVKALASRFNIKPPPLVRGPIFQMNLDRLTQELGETKYSLDYRLDELVAQITERYAQC